MAKKKTKTEKNVDRAPRITVVGIGASAGGIEALREFFVRARVLLRFRPYRTAEDKIDGVVITFVT